MRALHSILKRIVQFGMILTLGATMNANAGWFGFGGDSWNEEVLLHYGQKIIVKRSQSYGGMGEIGQGAPIKEYHLVFVLPNSGKSIEWKSEYSEDVGRANLHPLALHVLNGIPYVIAEPNLCLAYNKWGRPNPPYVIFKYGGKEWQRITIQELPIEFKTINLVNNTKSHAEQLEKSSPVSAEAVQEFNRSLPQPEYKTILREALAKERINEMCMEMIRYKGYWIMPNDPVARGMVDRKTK
jgi:hypothetical protein